MENTMEPIMVPYVAIYSAPMVSLDTKVEVREIRLLLDSDTRTVVFQLLRTSQVFRIWVCRYDNRRTPGSLPGGSYVIISTEADIRTSSERERVALLVERLRD